MCLCRIKLPWVPDGRTRTRRSYISNISFGQVLLISILSLENFAKHITKSFIFVPQIIFVFQRLYLFYITHQHSQTVWLVPPFQIEELEKQLVLANSELTEARTERDQFSQESGNLDDQLQKLLVRLCFKIRMTLMLGSFLPKYFTKLISLVKLQILQNICTYIHNRMCYTLFKFWI